MSKSSLNRKENSEFFIQTFGIKINPNLPELESEDEVNLRSAKEIAERATILSVLNLVATDLANAEEALSYLTKYNLLDAMSPMEKLFLENPTEEKKIEETWKTECIWILMWALNLVPDVNFPNELCNLNDIPENNYPVQSGIDPNTFIQRDFKMRDINEILDKVDLYYRIDWACVDANLNGIEIEEVECGVVYQRHYALNWLIYAGEEWDDVTCDT